jgi:pantothenate kinase
MQNKDMLVNNAMRHSRGALRGMVGIAAGVAAQQVSIAAVKQLSNLASPQGNSSVAGTVHADGAVQNEDMLVSKAMRHSRGALRGMIGIAAGVAAQQVSIAAVKQLSNLASPQENSSEAGAVHADGAVQNEDMLVSKAMRHSRGALRGMMQNRSGEFDDGCANTVMSVINRRQMEVGEHR